MKGYARIMSVPNRNFLEANCKEKSVLFLKGCSEKKKKKNEKSTMCPIFGTSVVSTYISSLLPPYCTLNLLRI